MAAQIREEDVPPETGYVQPGLLECRHAEALRRLGDLMAAQEYAEEALRSADSCHLRGQTHRLATLAIVLAERRELDQAAATAEAMLDRAQGMESERIAERIDAVSAALRPFDSRPVRDFLTRARHHERVPL